MSEQISVIIPCYKLESYIERTIRSLLAQTYPHWLAVIASDDQVDYLALLKTYGIEDSRISQVYTGGVGTGVSKARNTALRACKTDYIAMLDGDDAFAPNRLEKLVPLLAEHPIIVTGFHYIDDITNKELPTLILFEHDQNIILENSCNIIMHYANSYCFDRRIIKHLCYENIKQAVDHLWAFMSFNYVEKIYFSAEKNYYYYKRLDSLVNGPNSMQRYQNSKRKIVADITSGKIQIHKDSVKEHLLKIYKISLEVEDEYEKLINQGIDVQFGDISMRHFKQAGMIK